MTNRTPTTISPPASPVVTPVPEPHLPAVLDTGAIVLKADQLPKAQQALDALDFGALPSADIIKFGFSAEEALQRTLDGFLNRLDDKTAAKVFDLFGRLERGVDDAKLPEVLERIQNGDKPGFLQGLFSKFTGKSADDAISEFMEEVGALISGRTRTLASKMQSLEGELNSEMQKLTSELASLDALKKAYASHFADFTFDAAVARAFIDKAKLYIATREKSSNPADVAEQSSIRELHDKFRLLESRGLALEGVYTRLPADQMVIQQIEQAGVATLQEAATTIAARFSSIKMTLLSLHSAFAVKSVQQISERQKKMDEQLTKLREMAVKDVAVSAAKAPGDNRLAQAQQIETIIASTREIHALVEQAKQQTAEKFEIARQKFAKARDELAALDSGSAAR